MRTYARDARRDLPLALVAAFTTWLTMFSWRGFSADWGRFLGPLLVIALVVSVGGVAWRAALMSERAGIAVHVLVVLVAVWLILGGSFIHPVASSYDIDLAIQNGWVSASTNVAPVPETVPSIAPLMIVCGAGALLLVDVFACWLHRAPLAGLPLLAVYGAPVIGFDGDVSWLLFVIAAGGFLLMMFLQESARISRWGRLLGATGVASSAGFGEGTGASRARAGTIGGVAVVLAVILPLFLPSIRLHGVNVFGTGGGGGVTVVNPIVSMRRDLHRGQDVRLLDVTTNNPDPSYLRIAVLTTFNGVTWTTARPAASSDNQADGPIPILEQGLDGSVVKKHYRYTVRATSTFDSTWLPTQFPVSDVVASGTWNYDPATMNFFAGDTETNTRGLTYHMTAAVPHVSRHTLLDALPAPQFIRSAYLTLPPTVPWDFIHGLAVRATDGVTNQYRAAVRLQNWFRTRGGFHYNLDTHPTDGKNALVDFLTRGHGGRVGYCEQFASAYAVMARSLNIPARVAVGFLQPTHERNGDWIYSAYDLHAWPELYFRGSGWIRFEPTPAARARVAPPWTVQSGKNHHRHHRTRQGGLGNPRPTESISLSTHPTTGVTPRTTSSSSSGFRFPWVAVGEALAGLAVAGALLLVPSAVRGSRRARRLRGGAEDAWAELRDTAIDVGVAWPAGRSPRETGARLARWFGAETEGPPPVRPLRGRGVSPDAEEALDRIVLVLEQVRYARSADDVPGALAGDVQTCMRALELGCTRATSLRARWLPRSMFARSATVEYVPETEQVASMPGGARDHVG